MVSGRPPFIAEGVGELFAKHMLEDPPPVTEFAPNVPPHMAAAIMKALAKEPDARFASMEEFRKAIVGEIKVAVPASAERTGTLPLLQHAGADDVAARVDDAVVGVVGDRRIVRRGATPAPADVRAAGRRRRWRRRWRYFVVFKDKTPPEVPKPWSRTTTPAPSSRRRRRPRRR